MPSAPNLNTPEYVRPLEAFDRDSIRSEHNEFISRDKGLEKVIEKLMEFVTKHSINLPNEKQKKEIVMTSLLENLRLP